MVAVALDELRNVFLPQGRPLGTSAAVLVEPFVVKLVDHQNAVFVTQIHKAFAIGVVRGTDMVHAERFQQLNAFLDGTVVCRRAQRAQRMVVGDAFQQHFLSVELHAEGGRELYRAHAEMFAHAVCHRAVFVIERHLYLIQMRTFAVPQTGICQPDRLQPVLAGAHPGIERQLVRLARHYLPFGVGYHRFGLQRFLLGVASHLRLNVHRSFRSGNLRRGDVERMTHEVHLRVGHQQMHVTEQSASRVPA